MAVTWGKVLRAAGLAACRALGRPLGPVATWLLEDDGKGEAPADNAAARHGAAAGEAAHRASRMAGKERTK